MNKILIALLCAVFTGLMIGPVVIKLIKKLKARQTILSYVEHHKNKEGVPTMGGIIFLIPVVIFYFVFRRGESRLSFVALIITLCYGVIGFLDDFIKVVLKRNLGLKAYQKIISQLVIAILSTIFAYESNYIGSEVYIPVLKIYLDLKWWYYPLSVVAFLATTNCVNLTDGLDGLAGSTSGIYLTFLFFIVYGIYNDATAMGNVLYTQETYNILLLLAVFIGGITAFLFYNVNRASVFMGDTGSLALGGICCTVPMFIKNPLFILLCGMAFVVSGASVIIQVVYYKLRKNRVFLMAPFHHHLEMKGLNESKIVSIYSIFTAIFGVVYTLII